MDCYCQWIWTNAPWFPALIGALFFILTISIVLYGLSLSKKERRDLFMSMDFEKYTFEKVLWNIVALIVGGLTFVTHSCIVE